MTNEASAAAADAVASPTVASVIQLVSDKSKINPLDGDSDEVKSINMENSRAPLNNGDDGHIDQSNGAEHQHKSSGTITSPSVSSASSDAKGRGRALEFAPPTVMSAAKDTAEPAIFVTALPPSHGGLAVVKGKSMKDLADVSMDETDESMENDSREKTVYSKVDKKECKKVS